jgi:hypothetical protein
METFATDGGVQPQLQPHSDSAKLADWKLNSRDPFPADGARELRSSVSAFRNEALLSPFISTGRNGLGGGHSVGRFPGALRLHSSFLDLKLAGWLINSESQGKPHGIREPVLITRNDTIISGFADWHAAVSAGQPEVECIEFALDDDEALQLILSLHRPKAAWNDFIRIELALKQESYFQSKARANQSEGGKHKGLANLPNPERIDVRKEIANLAGVCTRNVGKVKLILKKADQQLIEALHNGTITINRALQLCQLQKFEQAEALAYVLGNRSSSKITRQAIDKLRLERLSADISGFLDGLQRLEATNPGSVEIRPGTREKTVILMGKNHCDLARRIGSGLA